MQAFFENVKGNEKLVLKKIRPIAGAALAGKGVAQPWNMVFCFWFAWISSNSSCLVGIRGKYVLILYLENRCWHFSRLGMGNMRLPEAERTFGSNAKIYWVKSQEVIDYAMSHGINYYDTAYIYNDGDSERFLGSALQKYPRDSFYIATKFFIQATPKPGPPSCYIF